MWQQNRGREKKKKWFVILLTCAVLMSYGIFFTERIVKPTLVSIGEIKAKSMMVQTVNEVVREKYQSSRDFEDLLDIKTDDTGKVTLVQANSAAMNRLSYTLAWEIQQRLKKWVKSGNRTYRDNSRQSNPFPHGTKSQAEGFALRNHEN